MPGALGWFQKYQKSLMLVLLAPALIGMGITGAIMSVMRAPEDQVFGHVFGQPVTHREYMEVAGVYERLNRQDQDAGWRFYALYDAARRAGLAVSDAEVGAEAHRFAKSMLAQQKALEEAKAAGLRYGTQQFQQFFQQRAIQYVLDDSIPFDYPAYAKQIREQYHMTVQAWEAHQRREALVQRYLDTLRELATVSPADVRKEFQDEHHQRALDLLEFTAAAYVPKADAAEGDPGYVSDEQVKAYYEARPDAFTVPRRVKLGFLAAELGPVRDALEDSIPGDDALKAFNASHGIAPAASFTDARAEVVDAWIRTSARDKVGAAFDAVADAVDAAEGTPDLAAIGAAVSKSSGVALTTGETGLIEASDLAEQPTIGGRTSARWFKTSNEVGATSDPLAGDDAWYVLQTREVEQARTPPFEEVKDLARTYYVDGAPRELETHYEQFKGLRYRQDETYVLEAVVARFDKFKDADKEGDDGRLRARDALDQALKAAQDWYQENPSFSVYKFQSTTDLPDDVVANLEVISEGSLTLTSSELETDPIVGPAFGEVATRVRQGFSTRPIAGPDGSNLWFGYRVLRREEGKLLTFDEAKAKVVEDVRQERATERAEEAAKALLAKLAGLTGDALKAALAEAHQEPRRTEFFDRDAVSLEGIADAGQLVAEAYSADAEVDGPYLRSVRDEVDGRVFLVRVAAREDAPAEKLAEVYGQLRKDLLSSKRSDFAQEQINATMLRAKGIVDDHLAFAERELNGPGGATKVTLRQIFLPPDRSITDGWLKEAARKRIQEAQDLLAKGTTWAAVVERFSEDDSTRSRGGELPAVKPGDWVTDFGFEFEEAAFALPLAKGASDGVSEPLESRQGLHLVRKTGQRGDRTVFQHLLIKLDPEIRGLPAEVQAKAEAASKERLEEAKAKLAAGTSFATVAEEFGDALDPNGQGQEFDLQYVTPIELAAFEQPLASMGPTDELGEADPAWVAPAVEVALTTGNTWQLFLCDLDREDEGSRYATGDTIRNRFVYHVQASSQATIESARARLAGWLKEKAAKDGGRPGFQTICEEFGRIAAELSEAPTKTKGGALGRMMVRDSVRPYGTAFLQHVFDGSLAAGARLEVFRSAKGYHLVEVVEVEVPTAETEANDVAQALLAGTTWR